MNTFQTYLQLGWEHIINPSAYDHLVYLLALCAPFTGYHWRKVLVLATAFTLGHSITLALTALDFFDYPSSLIEILIPCTILFTVLMNLFMDQKKNKSFSPGILAYLTAGAFGLIHGMGFSSYFKGLLGQDSNILVELLSFNLGIELGQIAIILVYFLLVFLLVRVMKVPQKSWLLFVSGIAAGVSIMLLLSAFNA